MFYGFVSCDAASVSAAAAVAGTVVFCGVGDLEPVADEGSKGRSAGGDDTHVLSEEAQGLSTVVEDDIRITAESDLRPCLCDSDEHSSVAWAEDTDQINESAALHLQAPDDGNG